MLSATHLRFERGQSSSFAPPSLAVQLLDDLYDDLYVGGADFAVSARAPNMASYLFETLHEGSFRLLVSVCPQRCEAPSVHGYTFSARPVLIKLLVELQ